VRVVTAAVKQESWALEHASSNQRGNIGVVLAALRQNPAALEYISQEFIVAATTHYN